MNLLNKLEIIDISFSYNDKEILKNISLEVQKGQTIAILGESGIGKSTLFKIILGILKPNSGKILIDGTDITNKTGNIGYMPQNDLLLEYKNVYDNISLPMIIKQIDKKTIKEKIEKEIKKFGLEDLLYRYPKELSGGQKQRVSFLRAYMYMSNIILLDEPFSSLDRNTKNELYIWLKDVTKKFELTNIIITHDYEEAKILADKIYVLEDKLLPFNR